MKSLTSFLKQCIAEVITEPVSEAIPRIEYKINGAGDVFRKIGKKVESFYRGQWSTGPYGNSIWDLPVLKPITLDQAAAVIAKKQQGLAEHKSKRLRSFVRHCIAEVIVEPGMTAERLRERVQRVLNKRVKIVGNPKKFDMTKLIKECTLEILKEKVLTEAFDPSSQGPNIPQENPYPAWNAKMAKMEEEEAPHGRYAQQAGATPFQTPTDYDETKTFQEIRDREDPKGVNHDLTMECVHCGRKSTCRCSKPKRLFKGVCESCAKIRIKEEKKQESSLSMNWQCTHCQKKSEILLEIESPADYVAFADCQHCGKEISDPKLDKAIYEVVIRHYKVLH
jgi:hypothetical protein